MTGPFDRVADNDRRAVLQSVDRVLTRLDAAERGYEAACAELRHVLEGLPYENARSGKYRKLRRRLERFLSERIEGL